MGAEESQTNPQGNYFSSGANHNESRVTRGNRSSIQVPLEMMKGEAVDVAVEPVS